jgi:hypothetical protein
MAVTKLSLGCDINRTELGHDVIQHNNGENSRVRTRIQHTQHFSPVYTHNNPVAVSTDVPISSHLILTSRKNSAAAMRRQWVVKGKGKGFPLQV